MALLEICCYSMECALRRSKTAQTELNYAQPQKRGANAVVGGTEIRTPAGDDPCASIIRPRGGDFCYSDGEFAAILRMCAQSAN